MTIGNKLAIGTAQFGLNYGIANKVGKLTDATIASILQEARNGAISVIDTAVGYGNAHQRLGENDISQFSVVTKLPGLNICSNQTIVDWVFAEVETAKRTLNVGSLYGLLLHKPDDLLTESGKELYEGLTYCKKAGLISKIGYSIYSPDILKDIFDNYPPDIIQAPMNVFDRRIERSGWLTKMHDLGVEIHVRSAFLQGLLLMTKEERPSKFSRWERVFAQYDTMLAENGINAKEYCINFLLKYEEIDKIVVGVDSVTQLNDLLMINHIKIPEPSFFPVVDEMLINPSKWNQI